MTPNLPSLKDTATRRSPNFASDSGRLKSSAAPMSSHSSDVLMFLSGIPLRDHISYTLAPHAGSNSERNRTSHHAPRHLAPAALPAAAVHHFLAGSRQCRLRETADGS